MTSTRIEAVRTMIVCGGTAPTRLAVLRALLARRPEAEPWAILRATGGLGLSLAIEPAPGLVVEAGPAVCPGCSGSMPLRVVLNRLLRRSRPQCLVVELAHPRHEHSAPAASILDILAGDAFHPVLSIEQVIDLDAGESAMVASDA